MKSFRALCLVALLSLASGYLPKVYGGLKDRTFDPIEHSTTFGGLERGGLKMKDRTFDPIEHSTTSVSYTHLTLPTILRV